MSDRNAAVVEEFRANGGNVGGFFEDKPLLLLHHTGARSGVQRVSPLMYQELSNGQAIFASKGGAPSHPDWFRNILANPEVEVEVGPRRFSARARVVEGNERESIWEPWKRRFSFFAEYEAKADREIPVVVLEPIDRHLSSLTRS